MKKFLLGIILFFSILGANAENVTYTTPFGGDIGLNAYSFAGGPGNPSANQFCIEKGGTLISRLQDGWAGPDELYNYQVGNWILIAGSTVITSITCDIPTLETNDNKLLQITNNLVGGTLTGTNTLLTGNLGSIIIILLVFAVIGLIIYGIRKFI